MEVLEYRVKRAKGDPASAPNAGSGAIAVRSSSDMKLPRLCCGRCEWADSEWKEVPTFGTFVYPMVADLKYSLVVLVVLQRLT